MKKNDPVDLIAIIVDCALAYVKRVSDLLHLASLEAQLALRTLVVIAMAIFLLSSLITVFWISLQTLIFIGLLALHFSAIAAGLIVVGINLVVLTSVFIYIYSIKENLFFHATRNQLAGKHTPMEDPDYEKITTEN
jgi:hypothetical protein